MDQMSLVATNLYQNATRFSFNNGTRGLAIHLLGHCLQQRWGNPRQREEPRAPGLYPAPSSQPEGSSPLVLFAAQKKPMGSPAAVNQMLYESIRLLAAWQGRCSRSLAGVRCWLLLLYVMTSAHKNKWIYLELFYKYIWEICTAPALTEWDCT